ncbi:MAG: universal stress protein [Acidobacteriota bacterium]|nr:universal stress protein [Acidobacteriota bacterium]
MTNKRIVVGIDGSDVSKDALRWAAAQARLTGAHLHVVMAWEIPALAYMATIPNVDWEKDTQAILEQTLKEVLGAEPDVEVTTEVAEGHPAPVLLDRSDQADLLVVGSRGHGAFTGMLIGSVSEHVVTHAHCPVVVVRPAAGS